MCVPPFPDFFYPVVSLAASSLDPILVFLLLLPGDAVFDTHAPIFDSYFSGYKNKDVAFLHSASKTLVQADLLFNLPAKEQYSKTGQSGELPILGTLGLTYKSFLHPRMVWALGEGKEYVLRIV